MRDERYRMALALRMLIDAARRQSNSLLYLHVWLDAPPECQIAALAALYELPISDEEKPWTGST